MKHAIIDWETLDCEQTCVVLSLGIVLFDEHKQYTYEEALAAGTEIKFSVRDQVENYGRTTSKETIDWWKQQGEGAQRVLMPSSQYDFKLREGMEFANNFISNMSQKGQIWCRGTDFDPRILKDVQGQLGHEPWVDFWNFRDVRTALQCWTGNMRGRNHESEELYKDKFVKHNALHDCAAALMDMQHAFNKLMG